MSHTSVRFTALALLLLAGGCGDGDNDDAAGGGQGGGNPPPVTIPSHALIVDTTADETDAAPGDGACASSTGHCALRAAIMEANATQFDAAGERFTIMLPAGRYELTIPNALSTSDLGIDGVPGRPVITSEGTGQLILTVPMTIRGAGARDTVIDAKQLDRVFEIDISADSVISDLTITGGAGNTLGGGVYAQALIRLERVHITGNTAGGGAGIFVNPLGELELIDSTVSHNESSYQAGGIRIDSRGTIINSTISHNRAGGPAAPLPDGGGVPFLIGKGGGVDIRGRGPTTIVNSTIIDNSADGGGAGIHFATAYTDTLPTVTDPIPVTLAEVFVVNTIVANNHSDHPEADCLLLVSSSRLVSLGHNLDSDGSCGLTGPGDLSSTDPQLDALADNGGATDTHAPQSGSPAIGAGDREHCPEADQRGVARPRDGACDIGAYERR